ncbi:MAG: DnaD domain protein [Desulfotomaculaceae bacterium]|nr:DnaD domain protein [Desulfotomaculaceae bacterium]
MEGWIKLWRSIAEDGTFKMPDMALKLWMYCLTRATPYPNPVRDLAAGELWLSYEEIRQNLGQTGVKISNTKVSNALKYLKQNNYLELKVEKFKGIRARVLNWTGSQSGALSVLSTSPAVKPSNPPTVPVEKLPGALGVPVENPVDMQVSVLSSTVTVSEDKVSRTPTVPADKLSTAPTVHELLSQYSATTPTVHAQQLSEYRKTTPTVRVRGLEPYSGAASHSSKKIKELNNKELKNKDHKNNDLNNNDLVVEADLEEHFARALGRELQQYEVKYLTIWRSNFSEELILAALSRAVLEDIRKVSYVSSRLTKWQLMGIRTVADIPLEEQVQSCSAAQRCQGDGQLYNGNIGACNVTVTPPETETESEIKDVCSSCSSAPAREEDLTGQNSLEEKPDLTGAFEQEFGRPLLPVEIKQLNDWAKESTTPVILEALKYASFAGKFQLRYINGILTNWLKNNLRTVQQINAHEAAFKLRNGPKGGKSNGLSLWV